MQMLFDFMGYTENHTHEMSTTKEKMSQVYLAKALYELWSQSVLDGVLDGANFETIGLKCWYCPSELCLNSVIWFLLKTKVKAW